MVGPHRHQLLSDSQYRQLARWIRSGTTPQRVVLRSRVLLLADRGYSNRRIALECSTSTRTVALWRRRFGEHGIETVWRDAPGRGRKQSIDDAVVDRLVSLGRESDERRGRTLTVRSVALEHGISPASVHRIWKRHGVRARNKAR